VRSDSLGLTWLVLTLLALLKRRFRSATSYTLAVAIVALFPLWNQALRLGIDYARLVVNERRYLYEIEKVPVDTGPRLLQVPWGITADDALITLVYDESGEVALPAGNRSESWKRRAPASIGDPSCTVGRHLRGHFYIIAC
jgi:hypothetical protein